MSDEFKRAYKACLNCRKRKARCVFEKGDRCVRCKRMNVSCEQPSVSRRGGLANILAGRERKKRDKIIKERLKRGEVSNPELWKQKELYNSLDALQILSQVAKDIPRAENDEEDSPNTPGLGAIPINPKSEFPAPTSTQVLLKDAELCRDLAIISPAEARILVSYFVKHMILYYPFLPTEYSSADKIASVPLLLATITCLSARYFEPESESAVEKALYERRGAVHLALWDYFQRLLSRSIWTEASVRSVSTVISFLLLTEWNPTAVHMAASDYASSSSEPSDDWLGLATSRRSDRMSWLLLGQAIRLAQDIGVMEASPGIYLAIHTSEIVLACRLGRTPMVSNFIMEPLPKTMTFTREEKAQLSCLKIMAIANKTLYNDRSETRELVRSGRFIYLLEILTPYLETWYKDYHDILDDGSALAQDLLFGYFHTRVYIYSLALMPVDGGTSLTSFALMRTSSHYIEMAVDAAKRMILVLLSMDTRLNRFLPIRWVLRLIHAIVFLVKSLLLSAPIYQPESSTEILGLIKQAAEVMLKAGPDNYHLCRHYGRVLLNLCQQFAKSQEDEQDISTPSFMNQSMVNQETVQNQDKENLEDEFSSNQHPQYVNFVEKMSQAPAEDCESTVDATTTFGLDFDFLMGNFEHVESTFEQLHKRDGF